MNTTNICMTAVIIAGLIAVVAVKGIEANMPVTVTSEYQGVEVTLTTTDAGMRAMCENLAKAAPFGPVTADSPCGRALGL